MVFRINKNENYTVMGNYHLREKELSLKSKGLLSLMLSLPKDWDYSINGLAKLSKDGKDSVMGALNELEIFGYLIRTRSVNERGQFDGYNYDIYEKPTKEKPCTENPKTDNQPQLNTIKINNTNNIKETNKEKSKFIPPTLEEVQAYAKEQDRLDLAQDFYTYYTATKWVDKNGKAIKSWKHKFITWTMRNAKPKTQPNSTYEVKQVNGVWKI